jgi:hypothetical protein
MADAPQRNLRADILEGAKTGFSIQIAEWLMLNLSLIQKIKLFAHGLVSQSLKESSPADT